MATRMRSMCRIHHSLRQSHGSLRYLFTSGSGSACATLQVEQFLAKAEAKSIDHRIVLQQVPDLMLKLIDDASNESGPMAKALLRKLREDGSTLSPKIYALVSECGIMIFDFQFHLISHIVSTGDRSLVEIASCRRIRRSIKSIPRVIVKSFHYYKS